MALRRLTWSFILSSKELCIYGPQNHPLTPFRLKTSYGMCASGFVRSGGSTFPFTSSA
jgi:hypothetical protein